MQLTCHCLNVCIHTRGTTLEPADISKLNLTNEEQSHNFFQNNVSVVILDLGGITEAQSILTTTSKVGDWTISTCNGCGLDTHAIHTKQRGQNVLVNLNLKNETTSITKLMETENYSSTFKIILPEINDNFTELNSEAEFQIKSRMLDNAVASIKKQVASYLQQEQKAMEDRIRLFTQQQQAEFATLQKKVRRDKQAMMYLLRKLQESELKENLGDAMTENHAFIPPLFHTDSGNAAFGNNKLDNCLPQMHIEVQTRSTSYSRSQSLDFHLSKKTNTMKSKHFHKKTPPENKDGDSSGIFDMEGLEHDDEDSAPSFSSDYEGDTDDSISEEPTIHSRQLNSSKQCAQSLPISVPEYQTFNRLSGLDDDEKVPIYRDPAQIAASIKASITATDGTEMFGDLPRRRLNTGDLVKSRPL